MPRYFFGKHYNKSPEEDAAWDLEEARWAFNAGNYRKASELLFRVMGVIIKEPDVDSEEYKNGEEKVDAYYEQEDEAEIVEGTVDEVDRDDYGYLIR